MTPRDLLLEEELVAVEIAGNEGADEEISVVATRDPELDPPVTQGHDAELVAENGNGVFSARNRLGRGTLAERTHSA